jgi:hypothetical protein
VFKLVESGVEGEIIAGSTAKAAFLPLLSVFSPIPNLDPNLNSKKYNVGRERI